MYELILLLFVTSAMVYYVSIYYMDWKNKGINYNYKL
jgi:hypothetical protein